MIFTNDAGWDHIGKADCPHLGRRVEGIRSEFTACQECGVEQDLRLCLVCGYVGCCESRGGHDTIHFMETRHPLIRPHRCDYDWLWCYECQAYLE